MGFSKTRMLAASTMILMGLSGSFAFSSSLSSRTRISNRDSCHAPFTPSSSPASSFYKQPTGVWLSSSSSSSSSAQEEALGAAEDDSTMNSSMAMMTDDELDRANAEKVAVDEIFNSVDVDGSGSIDMEEFHGHLSSVGYSSEAIQKSFEEIDTDNNGEISREEFREAILNSTTLSSTNNNNNDGATAVTTRNSNTASNQGEEIMELCPRGYFLDSVRQTCEPLGPLGRVSQKFELMGPFKKVHQKISSLFGIDTKKISELGVSFALSYSFISNLNGAISFSVAWYMTVKRTGLSPLAPGQWKSLLASYGMIYGLIQLLRPFRVAMAIAMSKLSAEYLEMTQSKLNCSRGVAVGCQYMMGQVMMAFCCLCGVSIVTLLTGVPLR